MESIDLSNICVRTSIEQENNEKVNFGSGIIIRDENNLFILTAAHCIFGENNEYKNYELSKIHIERFTSEDEVQRVNICEIYSYNRSQDWALLKVSMTEEFLSYPNLIRCKDFTLDEQVSFGGFSQKYGEYRQFDAKVIKNNSPGAFKISLANKTFSSGSVEGSELAKGLSGSGVFIIKNEATYLIGLAKSVIGDDAYFDDIRCTSIQLLDSEFSSPSVSYPYSFETKYTNTTNPLSEKFVTAIPRIGNSEEFIGRDKELSDLSDMLANYQKPIIISGIKGIGKSALVREFLGRSLNRFDHIGWINLTDETNDLEDTIANDVLANNNFVDIDNSPGSSKFENTLRFLIDLTGEKLLIIENIKSGHLSKIKKTISRLLGWKILLTTYVTLDDISAFQRFKVSSLSTEFARQLFLGIHQESDHLLIDKVNARVGYHTLTIEIVAKTCKWWGSDYTLQDIQNKFNESGLSDLKDFEADIYTDHSEEIIKGLLPYYEVLFKLDSIDDSQEKSILLYLSVMSATPILIDLFRHIFNPIEERAASRKFRLSLGNLTSIGLITFEQDYVSMHEVIQYFIRYKLNPTSNNCTELIEKLGWEIAFLSQHKPVNNLIRLPHAENLLAVLNENDSEKLAYFELNVAKAFQVLSLYEKSFEHLGLIFSRNKKLLDENIALLRDCYYQYGISHKHAQQTNSSEKAIKYLKKARDLTYAVYGKHSEELANCFGELGFIYLIDNDLINARKFFKKAYEIHLKIHGTGHKNIGMYHSNVGDIERQLKNYEKAIEQYNKARDIFENDVEHLTAIQNVIAICHFNLAKVFAERNNEGDLESAEEEIAIASKIFLEIYGDIHISLIDVHTVKAEIAFSKKKFEETIRSYEKAIGVSISLMGLHNSRMRELQKRLDRIYLTPGILIYFQNMSPVEILDISWNHDQIAHCHMARFDSFFSKEGQETIMEIYKNDPLTAKAIPSWQKQELDSAEIHFKISENQPMLDIINKIRKGRA
ncbi:hypothetical protein Dfri01_67900 [Dyadobacter frigoris]|uniref:tetratricopeptide repeat protein n=1 Tax=Dyadobacter frigoris TaxID=2576211 RepID=UPI0024A56B6E|nr:tetratricopeptide repeat protein [Dyadobacter frigoris]GLU57329.1 hypothetical protein Dfri01_67900 [Dyadobacter frigoris]